MKLPDLLAGYPCKTGIEDVQADISGITHDSRHVRPGWLYVCLEGLRVDGHLFAGEAVGAGAAAVISTKPLFLPVPVVQVKDSRHALSYLSDRFFGHPSRKLHVVGVTGTNGKTTTTHFLQAVYHTAKHSCAVIGTVGILVNGEYLPGSMTTPEAFDLHKTFHELARKEITTVAMEVSSHSLAWQRVDHVHFSTAVFTNLSHDHLDFHKTMDEYFLAKARLFTLLHKNNRPQAIINGDDSYGRRLLTMVDADKLSFGMGPDVDVRGTIIKSSIQSTVLAVTYKDLEFEVHVRLPGEFNAYNALAAVATALAEGIAPDVIACGIDSMHAVPGRLETVQLQQDYAVFIDFAHTPDGLEKVLKTLHAIPHQRLITVFGCPGDRDRSKRPVMGMIAEKYSDLVIVTSDNPASESAETIIHEILTGMHGSPVILPDRTNAVSYALKTAQKGDIVLLAGKGHENYQLIGEQYVPYSDRRAVEAYFQNNGCL